jgi:hypothetical protein
MATRKIRIRRSGGGICCSPAGSIGGACALPGDRSNKLRNCFRGTAVVVYVIEDQENPSWARQKPSLG